MIKMFLLLLVISSTLTFPQQVYNYIGRSSNKLPLSNNAQITRDRNKTHYAWFNETGFYFFLAKNGTVITARRDMLVSTENVGNTFNFTLPKVN